ncbi:hypothetical protein FACS189460_0450 [Deltaproteobacteria bacterium]|nr:hypothetical protein FACS189460_0450 [Deltaproteobacteria bacterium]
MSLVRLGDIADVTAGQSAPQGNCFSAKGTPFVRAGSLEPLLSGKSERELEQVSDEVAKANRLKLQPEGTIVFAKSGMSCMKGYVYVLQNPCYVVSHLACVLPKSVGSNYLSYYFKWHKPNQLVKDEAYPSISLADISNISVEMHSAERQGEIVEHLDKACELIALRKQQVEALDLMVKSRFVDMFGDPVSNPMGWDVGTIRDIAAEVKYGTSKPASEGGRYPYLRMNNITYDGQLDLSDLKYIDVPDHELEKYVVRQGDVLFNRTNSKELVGKTCVFNQDKQMVIAGYIIRVRLNMKAIPTYLSTVLNSGYGKTTLRAICKSIIGQANINAQELQNIRVLIPPVPLQNRFAEFAEAADKSKFDVAFGV